MSLPEGNAAANQVVRQVRSQQHGIGSRFQSPGRVDRHGGHHLRIDVQGQLNRVNGIEQGFLVFLKIAVVGQGQPLDGHHHGSKVAVQASRFAAGKFGDVRIFLLGHQGGARGMGVRQGGEAEFRRTPQDDVLAHAGEVGADHGQVKEGFHDVIPVGNGIHGILRYGVKAQFCGNPAAVQADGGTGNSSGTQRGNVQAPAAVREAVRVPVQHFHVSQQMVAHRDGLGALQVGIARHHGVRVLLRLHDQRALQMAHFFQDFINLRPAVKPCVRSHLVVAGACGMQLGTRRADASGQLAFNVHVHVFQLPAPREAACLNVLQNVLQAGFNGAEFLLRKQACLELCPRMGDGSGNVLAEEPPVVGDGFAVALNQISGGFRKSAFPHDPHVVPEAMLF